MAYTPEQLEFLRYRDAEAERFGNATLPNNPNLPYKEFLSPVERKYAVYDIPEVRARAEEVFNTEEMASIDELVNSIDWENRVAPYNRPPIEYDVASRHKEYTEQRTLWEEYTVGS